MLKLLRAILFILGLIVVLFLSVANRQPVDISFWPLPYGLTVPLYWVFLFTLALGIVLGGLASWLSRAGTRVETRQLRRKVRQVEHEERLRREAEEQAVVEEARRKTQALTLAPPTAGTLVPSST
jgi:uncharacterized integral membrane protein